jgi:nitrogen fixation/metabolism regulation signal transduction histidine kinase
MPKPELERIDAKDLIDRVCSLYEGAASREAKIDFATEIASEPMPMMVDPELLHRALSNLGAERDGRDAQWRQADHLSSAARERTSKLEWRTRARV